MPRQITGTPRPFTGIPHSFFRFITDLKKNNNREWYQENKERYKHDVVIPIEVKSGLGRTLKSMRSFLLSHTKSPYGIRFSTQDYSLYENIHSYPLFAIAKICADHDQEMRNALESLI